MAFDRQFLDELIARNDIVDVVSNYVSLQPRGGSLWGCCPFHSEKTPSFHVLPDKQLCYCFGCKKGGGVINFIMEEENLSFPDAVRFLARRVNMPVPEEEHSDESRLRSRILSLNRDAARFYYDQLYSPKGAPVLEYMKNRKITRRNATNFGLGASADEWDGLLTAMRKKGYGDGELLASGLAIRGKNGGLYDKFRKRLIFPIIDVRGNVIGFGGRVMDDSTPKYLNSPETMIFDKSRNLYGLNFARTTKKHQILLCEGYMDVIALHQAGFDNAVAALGTAFTPGHANLLKRYTKEVYLTFDSDGAGIRAAKRAIPILKEAGITAKVINMKPYKDPDEFIKALGAEEYEKRIEQAENSFLFEIRLLSEEYDLKDPAGKTEFANETAKKLLQFSEELERDNYIEAIADKYGMGFENLRKLVYHFGTQGLTGSEPRQKKSREKPQKEDGMKQSQRLLLTWLIEDTRLFELIEEYLESQEGVRV